MLNMLTATGTTAHVRHDSSLWLLLASNVAAIFLAIQHGTGLLEILWMYWAQSVLIGIFNGVRIWQLKEFTTHNFFINGQPAPENFATKKFTTLFFLAHFGFFHFVYAAFLLSGFVTSAPEHQAGFDVQTILVTTSIFFFNHLFSYVYNKAHDSERQHIGLMMIYPYARIIPMHLIIVLVPLFSSSLLFFLILKTAADCAMHVVEHRFFRRGRSETIHISI